MKNYFWNKKTVFAALTALIMTTACLDDLDRFPPNDTTSKVVYSTFEGTKGAFAKIYGAYTLSGQKGPDGKPDVAGLDEGSNADFLRNWFNHQEMPTDEAHCLWGDAGVPELNSIKFTADSKFTIGLYDKCILQVMYANEFLKNASGDGFTDEQKTEVAYFRAEARFLRAFAYWVLMDAFGNPPFVTENDPVGFLPPQTNRKELFAYIEAELKDLIDNKLLKAPKSNDYGRADEAAACALLARVYLNAEVYIGKPYWTEAITYSKKVIESGYTLKTADAGVFSAYETLFLADNNKDNPEVILSINYDGVNTRLNGGTTFLINCGSSSEYQTTYASTLIHYGITSNANWNGYRFRKQFIDKFEIGDKRFLFVGTNKEIGATPSEWKSGLETYKYRNITSASKDDKDYVTGSDPGFADVDFPLFRVAEQYLILAEAVVRGGTGATKSEAVAYVNQLRSRAGVATINEGQLTADWVLDERARELYWECFRRTDLIRYGYFTGSGYIWEWKGGVQTGTSVDGHFNIFPLPADDVMANPNLKQNDKY